jgi:uncharacterized membrane protein YgdD (TMEM256/DUF423 family)
MKSAKFYIAIGSIIVLLGIVLGAFAAHALKTRLNATDSQVQSFKTGVDYQLLHGLAIILLGIISKVYKINIIRTFYMFIIGILCFSFSIYMLTICKLYGYNVSYLGPITPLGGVFFIIGWVFFILKIIKCDDVFFIDKPQ